MSLPPLRLSTKPRTGGIVALLATFLVLALAYSALIPIYEAPDELAHVDTARLLREERHLPLPGETGEAHQPPLYYALAALASAPASASHADWAALSRLNPRFTWQGGAEPNIVLGTAAAAWPWRGAALAIHLMRGVSVLLGLVAVYAVYRLGREVWPRQGWLPLFAAAIVAFNAQFLFIHSVVNNDALANAAAAVVLWMLARVWRGQQDLGTLIGLALALGLGLGAKLHLLLLLPLTGIVLARASWRAHAWRPLLRGSALIAVAVALLNGWWFARNLRLCGDLLGLSCFGAHRPAEPVVLPATWRLLRTYLTKMHRSYWGTFGWMNVFLPTWTYAAIAASEGLALIGGIAALAMRRLRRADWLAVAWLLAWPAALAGWTILFGARYGGSGWQGRYVLPAAGPLAVLITGGLSGLSTDRRRGALAALVGAGLLLALAVYSAAGVLCATYAPVTVPSARLATIQHPLDVQFEQDLWLRGYDLAVTGASAAEPVSITLYWESAAQPDANYTVFVHLVDLDWNLHGQADSQPLGGRFPTSEWRAGDLVADRHTVQLQEPLPPGDYRLAMGWYRAQSGERLNILVDGAPAGTVAETAPFHIP